MGDFKTYAPELVVLTWNGIIFNGFANDTFIEVERDEANFMKYTGSLGDVARSKNLNKGGKVTVTLMATAPINDELSTATLEDELLGGSFGPLQLKDLSGNMICSAEIAWIEKWPKVDRAKESGTIQWVIDCAEIIMFAGGNVLPF